MPQCMLLTLPTACLSLIGITSRVPTCVADLHRFASLNRTCTQLLLCASLHQSAQVQQQLPAGAVKQQQVHASSPSPVFRSWHQTTQHLCCYGLLVGA